VGLSCAGSLEVTATFTEYAADASVGVSTVFGAPGIDWSGATTYHLAIRFKEPASGNLNHLAWVQIYVQSDNYASYLSVNLGVRNLEDFGWHDVSFDISTAELTNINKIGVNVGAWDAAPAAGPTVPPTTIFYIDDIWIE
jgi:hypothetical protein